MAVHLCHGAFVPAVRSLIYIGTLDATCVLLQAITVGHICLEYYISIPYQFWGFCRHVNCEHRG